MRKGFWRKWRIILLKMCQIRYPGSGKKIIPDSDQGVKKPLGLVSSTWMGAYKYFFCK
jgi:hypothetical protein